jgi:hypothetical protein
MSVLGGLALGCDALGDGASKEPASVTAKTEPEPELERAPAGGSETKTAGEPTKDEGSSKAGSTVAPSNAAAPGSVVPPGAPTEPGAAEPASPPSTLPALAAVMPSEAAFSEKMQRRLRSKLREQHDARTQLASSLALPQPDGGVVVLALYELSAFEACVGQSDGSPEARKACANQTDDNERVLAGLRKCTDRGLVRARFGPPPKAQPAYGGELTVEATRPLQGGCTISTVRRFALEDVDGDGQPELALDVVGKTPQTTFRTETLYDVFTRTVGWYRTDLSPQFESALSEWFRESLDEEEGSGSTARRIRLEDDDGDGRVDLVIDEVRYHDDGECDLDETGWLRTIRTDETCSGEVVTVAWRYDPGKDQWIEPASSPR